MERGAWRKSQHLVHFCILEVLIQFRGLHPEAVSDSEITGEEPRPDLHLSAVIKAKVVHRADGQEEVFTVEAEGSAGITGDAQVLAVTRLTR